MPTRKTREQLDAEMNELKNKPDTEGSLEPELMTADEVWEDEGSVRVDRDEEVSANEQMPASDESPVTDTEQNPDEKRKEDKTEDGSKEQNQDEDKETRIDEFLEARLKIVLESLLFAAAEPVSLKSLTGVIQEIHPETNGKLIRRLLDELQKELRESARGIRIAEVSNSFQLRTPSETAIYIKKMVMTRPPRLTRATLETLAIVAYRQPVTRPEVEEIRGVDCGAVLRHLLEKKLVKILGRKDEPGRPLLYATTPEFLVFFGLKDLKSLPTLKDFVELTDEHKAQLGLDPSESEKLASGALAKPEASFEGLIKETTDSYSPVGTDEVITELAEALDEVRSRDRTLSKSDVFVSGEQDTKIVSESSGEKMQKLEEQNKHQEASMQDPEQGHPKKEEEENGRTGADRAFSDETTDSEVEDG